MKKLFSLLLSLLLALSPVLALRAEAEGEEMTEAMLIERMGEATYSYYNEIFDATGTVRPENGKLIIDAAALGETRHYVTSAKEGSILREGEGSYRVTFVNDNDPEEELDVVFFLKDDNVVELRGKLYGMNITLTTALYSVTLTETANGTLDSNLKRAVEGREIVLTATPDADYYLQSLSYSDGERHDVTGEKRFKMPKTDVTVEAVFAEQLYKVTEGGNGAWERYSETGQSFTVERKYDNELTNERFTGLSLDGRELGSENYSIAAPFTLTLAPAALNTLSTGIHTVAFTFADGTAEARFTVQNPGGGYLVTVTDYTKNQASLDLDPAASYLGETSFSLSSSAAVAVLAKTDEGYTRLRPDEAGRFTVDVQTDTELVLVLVGDVTLDGGITTRDVFQLQRGVAGLVELTPLAWSAGDTYRDGKLTTRDVNLLSRAVAGLAELPR